MASNAPQDFEDVTPAPDWPDELRQVNGATRAAWSLVAELDGMLKETERFYSRDYLAARNELASLANTAYLILRGLRQFGAAELREWEKATATGDQLAEDWAQHDRERGAELAGGVWTFGD